MPIYGKNLKKSSAPDPLGWLPWNLVCSIWGLTPSSLYKWWTWVDLDLFYGNVKFGHWGFWMEKSWKSALCIVAIVPFDTVMHSFQPQWGQGQGNLVSLAKGHMSVVCQHFQRSSSLKLLGQFELNFTCSLLAKMERKIFFSSRSHDQDGQYTQIW